MSRMRSTASESITECICKILTLRIPTLWPSPAPNKHHSTDRLLTASHSQCNALSLCSRSAYDTTNGRFNDLLDQMANDIEHQHALQILLREATLDEEVLCWLVLEDREDDVKKLLDEGRVQADAQDADCDLAIHLAASHGRLRILNALIAAGASLGARDHERATPLVLACIHGHVDCVIALLQAGADPSSKWQYLTPIQWAFVKKHAECEKACEAHGAVRHSIPLGRGETTDESGNRLRPPPERTVRRRRKAASVKSTASSGNGGGSASVAGAVADAAAGKERWRGHAWVTASLLSAVTPRKKHANFQQLCTDFNGLKCLDLAVRNYIQRDAKLRNSGAAVARPRSLPDATINSFSLRPGVRLRKTEPNPDVLRKIKAAHTLDASWFGREGAAKHFASIEHDDPAYVYFLGELLLCFTFKHEGKRHDCCYIRYWWPDVDERKLPAGDGISLQTRYVLRKAHMYEVVPVSRVQFRANLVEPPAFRDNDATKHYRVLNDDIYWNF